MDERSFKMELIEKESIRKHTFHKRKTSLVKKISEISILCGVDACLIVYAPKKQTDDNNNNEVVSLELDTVWPSDSDKIGKILDRYKKTQKPSKPYTVSDYLTDKKRKADSHISKLRNQIKEVKYPTWDNRLDNFKLDELRTLVTKLDRKIEVAGERLNSFRQNNNKDVMLQMSENMGMYMNTQNFEGCPFVRVPMPMPMPMPMSVPVPVWAGPGWLINWQQQQQQQQQHLFVDSNFYSGPGVMDSTASSSGSNRFNH